MSFDWRKFLDLAKQLQAQASEESQRSAISRAYYAALCTAKNHLASKGFVFAQTGEVHMEVWNRFKGSRQACRELGELGDRLRRKRIRADYDDNVENIEKEAEAAILDASEFFDLLKQRPNCP